MVIRTFWTVIAMILCLSSCREKFKLDKNFSTVSGNFKIGYLDKPDKNVLVFHEEDIGLAVLINPKVKRLGSNERFIIAERVGQNHILKELAGDTLVGYPIDTAKISFYIVDMTRKLGGDDPEFLFETSDYKEFERRKEELGISDLNFSKEFRIR